MVRGAKSYFGRIQGGEAGESPQRALTAKPTQESIKMAAARRVAQLFAIGGVVLPRETVPKAFGTVARLAESQKFAAMPHIRIFHRSHNHTKFPAI